MPDWRDIEDEREKYAAYLCSREWAELKEAVHARANGMCERCRVFKIDAVHHLTYARKYHELLEDLQGNCEHCHKFTHGKTEHDPLRDAEWIEYLRKCRALGRKRIDRLVAWKFFPSALMTSLEFIHSRAVDLYSIAEGLDSDSRMRVESEAHQYELCADSLQSAYEMDVLMWIRMDKPEPADWNFHWDDLA